jgi:23S rRNA (adenine2503-C2)-methyltransferase
VSSLGRSATIARKSDLYHQAVKPPISALSLGELTAWMAERGEPAYRARQVRRHVFSGDAGSFAEMTDLAKPLRVALDESFAFSSATSVAETTSDDGETRKTLLALADGLRVEAVLMPYHRIGDDGRWVTERNAVCISTQVGCAMACAFCATGEMGLARNLTVAEIVDQVRHGQRVLRARGERVSHVVFMGMGEPLHAYDATIGAVRTLTDPTAFRISARRITISTAGVVPKIDALAFEGLPVNLAVSLHAPNDRIRRAIMPIDRRWDLDAVLEASRRYVSRTKRRLTFEYVLLADVNDAPEHAVELVRRIRGDGRVALALFHVNLIPVNRGPGGFRRPPEARMELFAEILRRAGLAATVRISRGQDIAAGCGQLQVDVERTRAKAGV